MNIAESQTNIGFWGKIAKIPKFDETPPPRYWEKSQALETMVVTDRF